MERNQTAAAADTLWKDRKRTLFGLPWSFTRYRLTAKKLMLKKGFFTIIEDEILLYRVLDLRLIRTFGQRIFGLGTVVLLSGDAPSPEFRILNIKRSEHVRDRISELVEAERSRLRLQGRELVGIADETGLVAEASGNQAG